MFLICSNSSERVNAELLRAQAGGGQQAGEAIANKTGICDRYFSPRQDDSRVSQAAAYLETLNPEQRRAVEHGVRENDCTPGVPLLVIAGAGSGKTNTLAHRVAHLIVNGADPRRILLMTFSRRAAAEMTRRVERIARRIMGQRADIMTDALAWAGTFHGIGARLLARVCRPDWARSQLHDSRS